MNLATLKAAINGLATDENSCRFFKRYEVLKNLTKSELVDLIEQVHQAKYPGTTCTSSKTFRAKKIDLIRWLDYQLERATS